MSLRIWLNHEAPTPPSDVAVDAANIIGDIMTAFWGRVAFFASTSTDGTNDTEIVGLYNQLQLELSWVQACGIGLDEIFTAHIARFGPAWESDSIIGSLRSVYNGVWRRVCRAGTLATPLSDAEELTFGEALVALRQGDPYLVDINLTMLTELRAGRGLTEQIDWNVRIYAFRDFVPVGIVF